MTDRSLDRCPKCGSADLVFEAIEIVSGKQMKARVTCRQCGEIGELPFTPGADPRTSQRGARPRIRVNPDALDRLGFPSSAISIRPAYEYEEDESGHLQRVEYLEPVFAAELPPHVEKHVERYDPQLRLPFGP